MPDVILSTEPVKRLILDQKIDTQRGDMTRIQLNQYMAPLLAIPLWREDENKLSKNAKVNHRGTVINVEPR